MATWLGGLLLLSIGVLTVVDDSTRGVVARFSEWALASVTLIVATGLFASWRNVRHWGAYISTRYGVLLLVKSGVVVLVIAVAVISRRLASRSAADGGLSLSRLRRSVAAESGIAVVILGITAALTGTAQAYEVYAPAFSQSATDGNIVVTVHLDHTRVGNVELVVSTRRLDGDVQKIAEISGSLTEVDPPVGPLPVTFHSGGPGRAVAAVAFPDQGTWQVQLNIETSAINEIAVTATVPIK
jgi:copper transport protein